MNSNLTRPEGTESAAGESSHAPVVAMDDARMEVIMGRLLQVGVLLAASVVLVGGVMYVIAHAGESSNYRVFLAKPVALRHPAAMLKAIVRGDSSAIIVLGILLLVATPICRVIFAVIAFAIERDRLYVAISLTVLAVLLFGMLRVG
jgi:uncharacterized membrane protein